MLKGVFLRLLKICSVLWPAPSESSLCPQTTSVASSHTWGCLFAHALFEQCSQLFQALALGFCIQRHLFPLLFRALPLSPPLPLSPFANRPLSTLESAWFTGVWEMTLAGCRTVQKQGPKPAWGSAAALWTFPLFSRLEQGRVAPVFSKPVFPL